MTRHAIRRFALCAPRPDHRDARAARGAAQLMPLAGFALDVPNQVSNLGAFPEGAPIAASFATARIPTAGSSLTTAGPDGKTSSAQVAAEFASERESATARANADRRVSTDSRADAGETGRAGRRTRHAARREEPPVHGTSRVRSHRLVWRGEGISMHGSSDGRPSHASVARGNGRRAASVSRDRPDARSDALHSVVPWSGDRDRSAGR